MRVTTPGTVLMATIASAAYCITAGPVFVVQPTLAARVHVAATMVVRSLVQRIGR